MSAWNMSWKNPIRSIRYRMCFSCKVVFSPSSSCIVVSRVRESEQASLIWWSCSQLFACSAVTPFGRTEHNTLRGLSGGTPTCTGNTPWHRKTQLRSQRLSEEESDFKACTTNHTDQGAVLDTVCLCALVPQPRFR